MCDTLVALPSATADGSTLLAKNSDREPNEAQAIVFYPRQTYPAATELRCTYMTIPQARETHAVLLSKPFWMWGAEMGANDQGVAIGNEAVFSKIKVPATGLTGMDLLRLALERAASASEAVDVITSLLEQHGQGGSGGYQHKFFYHNSYLIADRDEAWVLETVDRQWAAQRVTGVRSISNGLTLGRDYARASGGLVSTAVKRGWCRGKEDFHFAHCYSDWLNTRFSQCRVRQPHTQDQLEANAGQITPAGMMASLRSHGPTQADPGNDWSPEGSSNASTCMHYSAGPIRISQSTGSLVAHLRADGTSTFWLTGTSAPCLSIFKPFYVDTNLPDLGPSPGAAYDAGSLWWQGERLHRLTLLDYRTRAACFTADRDRLEATFLAEETGNWQAAPEVRAQFSAHCIERAATAMADWTARVEKTPVRHRTPWYYQRTWTKHNRAARVPL